MSDELLPERHFLLYAKGHYRKSGDIMEDLTILVANYSGLNKEMVTQWDIYNLISDVTIPLMLGSGNPKYVIRKYLGRLVESARIGNILNTADFIEGMISFLAHLKIKDKGKVLLNLGKPDFNILPPSA